MRLQDALALYLRSKRSANLSESTVQWYRANIQAFIHWLEDEGVNGSNWLRPEIVEAFLESQREEVSASTVAARYRALNNFFGWLEERQFIEGGTSPLRQVQRPKEPKAKPRQADDRAIVGLLASIPLGSWIDLRDRLAVQILRFCGLRAAELVHLHVTDVDVADEIITVRGGKGGDDRPVPIMPAVARAYTAYMLCRPAWDGPELILSADGSHLQAMGVLTVSGLRSMLRRRCKAAGVQYLNPHSFRHGLAIRLLNRGADMSLVQDVLGHSRIQTTQERYARWTVEGLKHHYKQAMQTGQRR